MEVTGKIKEIFQTVENKSFKKKEFVITTNEQYPQNIKFELIKDKCSLIDNYFIGDEITVHFNIRGNEYNGKYFVNLQGWKIV
jgi:hypothetical protein